MYTRIAINPLVLGLLIFIVAGSGPSWTHARPNRARSFARVDRGYQRDLRRVAAVPKIAPENLEKALFDGKTSFTKSRLPKSGAAWRSWAEGDKPFSIDLGNGCKVQGKANTFRNPINESRHTRLLELKLASGGRSVSLMPMLKTHVSLDLSTGYWYDKGRTTWHGPVSKYSVLALFHEMGHAKDYGKMSEGQRAEFDKIYDLKSNKVKMTKEQKRKMVGFERSAWSHALRQVRQLKQQGFDVLAGSATKEVMGTIYTSMRGYYDYKGERDTMPAAGRDWSQGWPGR